MTAKNLPSLNGLRALSISFVLVNHIFFKTLGYTTIPGGQIGVNIFFIVSGFLITYLLLDEEKNTGSINLKNFYLRRILRIFPAYYFLLFTYFILQLAGILYFHTNSWITSLTYTKYFPIPNASEWESEHLWSLSIEEHFYLLWPFIFKFLKHNRVRIAILIILLIPIVRIFNFMNSLGSFNGENTIFQRGDALMTGCLLAFYREEISNWLHRFIMKYKFMIFAPLFGLIISVVLMSIVSRHTDSLLIGGIIRALGRSFGTITNIFVCLVILISINFKNNSWYRFLNTGLMNYAGKISYSLYIWQQLFFSDHLGVLSQFPINIICIFITAILSYHFLEKPFLSLKSKFEVRKSAERNCMNL